MTINKRNSKKINCLIQDYIENKITMQEVADKLEKTKSLVSHDFKHNVFPNPIELRKEFQKRAYEETGNWIDLGNPVDPLIEKYPFLKNKSKIQRLVRKGDIQAKKPVLTVVDLKKLELHHKIIEDFENNLSTSEILKKYSIPRGKLTSTLFREYGESAITKAKGVANERKKQK
ncbi:hypothetical protein NNC41_08035 [Enterococcus faecium]|nr:hypothetical protein [Enterococcus faecium]